MNSDPTAYTGFSTISGLAFTSSATVPEPSSLVLSGLAFALTGAYAVARRNKPV